jgi:hypothetical protein
LSRHALELGDDRGRAVAVTYSVLAHGAGWRVHSRGFTWYFADGAQAIEFANDMAEQFARALGQPTRVRLQDDGGGFHDLRGFEGAPAWPPPQARAADHGTVLAFARKA